MHKQDVLFVLTIDTEEEWQWDEEFPQHNCSVENVEKLPAFQTFCESLGIRPTYFADYAVASNNVGSQTLRTFAKSNSAEIGAHLHPWCNPPYFGKTTEAESHVINLPLEQVEQKLDALNALLHDEIGVRPQSFRSGRWGVSAKMLRLLASRGYVVDSSVYPFYRNDYFSCLGAPESPYWPSFDNALAPGEQRQLLELPVTAGFNIQNFSLAER
ncbi:MAG: WalW protein, partial [Pseudomonadota bacterium]|nr:WalW protein [Pseudomonadota bacterium]